MSFNERPKRPLPYFMAGEPPSEYIVKWIIPEVLPYPGTVLLYARPAAGKSTYAAAIAAAVATKTPLGGKAVQRSPVVYVALERPGLVDDRVVASATFSCNQARPDVAIVSAENCLNFGDHISKIEEAIICLTDQIGPPKILIIDTLARLCLGIDENDVARMQSVMSNLTRLADKHQLCIVIIHHEGKSGTSARGSSAILAAVDVAIRISVNRKQRTAMVVKNSYFQAGSKVHFQIDDRLGNGVGTAIISGSIDNAVKQPPEDGEDKQLPPDAQTALAVLIDLEQSSKHPVTAKQWKEAVYAEYEPRKTNAKRQAWWRSLKILRDKKLVHEHEDGTVTVTPTVTKR